MQLQDDIGKKPLLLYLAAMLLSIFAVLATSWAFTSTQRIRFLESGYAVWEAKQSLLRKCELGDVAIFGDSRIDSAIVPARMKKTVTNLGFAGGTPIENYFFTQSVLTCKSKPSMVILSFNPGAFEIIQPWLWDNAVRYGMIGQEQLWQVRAEGERLHDASYAAVKPKMGIDGLLRDIIYSTRFPAIYFDSLVEGRLLGRGDINRKKFAEVIDARGYPAYKRGAAFVAAHDIVNDTASFAPLPLQQSYFEKTVRMLDRAGIDTYFLITPYSNGGSHAGNAGYKDAYLAYLHRISSKYPRFHLLQEQVPVWPDSMFADSAHLNETGAKIFSGYLNTCVKTVGGARSQCDFQIDQSISSTQ